MTKIESNVRKDPKGRILRSGEYYDEVRKRYKYRYRDAKGKYHDVYAFRLTDKDPVPYDKPEKYRAALREIEKRVEDEVRKGIDATGGRMSVLSLVTEYTAIRTDPKNRKKVKPSTQAGYGTVISFLSKNPFGKRPIKEISKKEAKQWFVGLQTNGKHYSSLNQIKGVLKPAFQYAMESDWVMFNPFDFKMDVLVNDSETRDALSIKDMRRYLDFIKTSKVYRKYFDLMYILFNTGLRVSEMCGLTMDDIDFEKKTIHVGKQLMYKTPYGLYIETPKTESGYRTIPMLDGVDRAFQSVIANRPQFKKDPVIWDEDHKESASGFLFFTSRGKPMMETDVDHYFTRSRERFNEIYKKEIPVITPHVCRHTFCSNMVSRGMPVEKLKMMMGHKNISTTLDIYTHLGVDALSEEFRGVVGPKNYVVYAYDREPDIVALDDDLDDKA